MLLLLNLNLWSSGGRLAGRLICRGRLLGRQRLLLHGRLCRRLRRRRLHGMWLLSRLLLRNGWLVLDRMLLWRVCGFQPRRDRLAVRCDLLRGRARRI